jgi:hypothetical protein
MVMEVRKTVASFVEMALRERHLIQAMVIS